MTSKCWDCGIEFDCGDQTYKDVLGYMWHAKCFMNPARNTFEGDADYV